MRIEIKPIDLEKQRNITPTDFFIDLNPAFIWYKAKFTSEEPKSDDDVMQGWQDTYIDFDWRIKKESVSSIDMSFNHKKDHWSITLTVIGSSENLTLFFELESECAMMYKELCDYLFT